MSKNETGYIKYCTDDELRAVLAWFHDNPSPWLRRYYYACLLLALGMRIGEVIRLTKANFSNNHDRVVYILEKTGKVHERLVPDWMARELQEYAATIPTWTQWFFWKSARYMKGKLKRASQHISGQTIRWHFLKARTALGLDDSYYSYQNQGRTTRLYRITPHTLRHWAAEHWYDLTGHDIRATAAIIGHTSTETTLRYYISPRRFVERQYLQAVYAPLQRMHLAAIRP
jgi:integrase